MALQWTSTLSVGVPELDEQHRELFRCVARIRDVTESGIESDATPAIAFLRDYVGMHFQAEERYMAARRFPGLERHREEHALLLEAVVEIENDHRLRGPSANSLVRLEQFLSDWLRTHIAVTDLAMARFVRRARRG